MTAEPPRSPVSRPFWSTETTFALDVVQVTGEVVPVVLSLTARYFVWPVMSFRDDFSSAIGFTPEAGAFLTVILQVAFFFPSTDQAVMVQVPFFFPLTQPLFVTAATFLLLLFHLTVWFAA